MLLAVDTSTQMMGLALYNGDKVIGEMVWETKNRHTVTLAPAIDDLMQRSKFDPQQISCVGVAIGPGSFTSLRIGLALVKAIALSLKVPVIGVPTLDILAYAQPPQDIPMAALLKAGRGRFALSWYKTQESIWVSDGEVSVITLEELIASIEDPTYVCGEVYGEERQALLRKKKLIKLASPVESVRRPSYLAEIAWSRYLEKKFDDVDSLAPIYLRVAGNLPS